MIAVREGARLGAALTWCALIRYRCKLGLDLSNLLPDKVRHETRAWREMSPRWIDQAEGNKGGGNPPNTRTSMQPRRSSNALT